MKQVVIVRRDLRLRRAEVASCVARASSMFLSENREDTDDGSLLVPFTLEEREWFFGDKKVIVLGAQSEGALKHIVTQAEIQGLTVNTLSRHAMSDKIDYERTLVCAAIGPHDDDSIDQITGNLKLM